MAEKFLTGNKFRESDKVREIRSPYKNEIAGEVYISSAKDFNDSADYLNSVFKKYRKIPIYKKQELLNKISLKISERKDELARLITGETGKPIKFSRIEVDRAILTYRLGAEECSRIDSEVLPLDLLKNSENRLGIVRRFPTGLILGITPWNFPVNLVAHKISPALASSNVVMLKPSSSSLLCGIETAKIIFEACGETGTECPLNIITEGSKETDKHLDDSRIKMISFTGSQDVGWKIKRKADRQKVSLELGGNAGVIIDEGTNIDDAIPKIITGGFNSAGQSCISIQRIYAHESLYEEFREKLVEAVKKIKYGNPWDEDTISGPMITEEDAIRAESWIDEAKNAGAVILCGGLRDDAILQPTVVENAKDELKVKSKEVFAPLVTIDKFITMVEAVKNVNHSKYGLQAGLFSNRLDNVIYAYNNVDTGGLIINDASSYRMDSMPYGGVKDSGNSREGVKYAIREMTEEKVLVI